MEEKKIEELIRKYQITDNGDGRLKIWRGKTPDALTQIREAKPEILEYFARKREKEAQRRLKFESIPGLKELRASRAEWEEYREEFQQAMERGDGRLPSPPKVSSKAIAEKYPDAVFALMVQSKSCSDNYELAIIAGKAYDAIRDGESAEEVKANYENDVSKFVERHAWD